MKLYFIIFIATLVTGLGGCGRTSTPVSDLNDVSVRLKSGHLLSLFERANKVVLKLCRYDSLDQSRDCQANDYRLELVIDKEAYEAKLYWLQGFEPPYNTAQGIRLLEQSIASIKVQLDHLKGEERFEAEELLKRQERMLEQAQQIKEIIAALKGDNDPIAIEVELDNSSEDQAHQPRLTLNQAFQNERTKLMLLPFAVKFGWSFGLDVEASSRELPPALTNSGWLDAKTGLLWRPLPHKSNWYTASDLPNAAGIIDHVPGCRRAFGDSYRLPTFNEVATSGFNLPITSRSDILLYWLPEYEAILGNELRYAVCVSPLVEADPQGDYDKDGVTNINDLCHQGSQGTPVDANGCEAGQAKDNWDQTEVLSAQQNLANSTSSDATPTTHRNPSRGDHLTISSRNIAWNPQSKIQSILFHSNDDYTWQDAMNGACGDLLGQGARMPTRPEVQEHWQNGSEKSHPRTLGEAFYENDGGRITANGIYIYNNRQATILSYEPYSIFSWGANYYGPRFEAHEFNPGIRQVRGVLGHLACIVDLADLKHTQPYGDFDGDGVPNLIDKCHGFDSNDIWSPVDEHGCHAGQTPTKKPEPSEPSKPAKPSKPTQNSQSPGTDYIDYNPGHSHRYVQVNYPHNHGKDCKTTKGLPGKTYFYGLFDPQSQAWVRGHSTWSPCVAY